VGIENGPTDGDESKRTPMPWDGTVTGGFSTASPWFQFAPGREHANVALQTPDGESLLSWYRRLIRARRSSAALRRGDLVLLTPDASSGVLAFVRRAADEQAVAIHNLTSRTVESFPVNLAAPADPPLVTTGAVSVVRDGQGWRVRVPAHASAVWRVPR
jgi:glycosidase